MGEESVLSRVTLETLVAGKPKLFDIGARTTCAEALELLDKHKVLSLPIWGQPGAWVGAGGRELVIGRKQYIGFVSILDIVSCVMRRAKKVGTPFDDMDEAKLPEALAAPVFEALGATDESLSFWVETRDRDVLSAMEELSKGVHRILVLPPPDSVGAQTQAWTEDQAEEGRVLSQTDVLKHISTAYRAGTAGTRLTKLLETQLSDLQIACNVLSVTENSNVVLALYHMVEKNVQAIAVIDESGKLTSTLSVSNFRGIVSGRLASLHYKTVGDFLREYAKADKGLIPVPLTCDPAEPLIDIIEAMLTCHVHRSWVTDSDGKPIDVVTYTDVISLVYRSEKFHNLV